jgi:hypothetical protein
MPRDILITPDVSADGVVFRFGKPVSLLVVSISDSTDEFIWTLEAEEFQPLPEGSEVGEGQMWRMEDAPAWAVEALRQVEDRADRELETRGPTKPLLTELRYGDVPAGYKSEAPAPPLRPGRYSVVIFAEQGSASAQFNVPDTK